MYRLITDVDKIERPGNPRFFANIFEILTFSWLLSLFKKGHKRELEENDLYETLDDYKSSPLGNELEKKWNSEVSVARESNRNPSLLRALIEMFGAQCMGYGLLFATDEMILKISRPLLIGGLLSYLNSDGSNKTDIRYAYVFASGLVCNILISTILYHATQIENLHCAMKMRVSCSSLIFRKALRLSHAALEETTVGHMVNLLSNDVNRFDTALTTCPYLWIGPVQTIIVTYFIWREIGYSSLIGVVILLIFIPMQVCIGKKLSEYRKETANKTDKRLRLMNELISGIQVIKMYTWEKPFAKLIEYARKQEIQQVGGATYFRSMLSSISQIQSRLQLFISIVSYVLLGNYISIQKVYVVTSFIYLLEISMGYFFSIAMEYAAEVLVSIKRIQNFLLLEERDGLTLKSANTDVSIIITCDNEARNNCKDIKYSTGCLNNNFDIVFSNVSARWTIDQVFNTLDGINLNVRSGMLVAVIGQIGAGKSSLIQAILRELPLIKGSISLHGIVSYASQEPWLFCGTVQQNILFDSAMDKNRYNQVVKSCALEKDFEIFPYGDKTTVGEKGINLSGGQKSRINLARAIYKQADIYLLDDPLSAVDTHVGKHLFEKCIKHFLKDKTCILTTHQIEYLTNVDKIILMENAKILAEGSYQELQASDLIKLLGSSDDVPSTNNIDQFNINNNIDTYSILSPKVSNENILSSENEPNDEAECRNTGHVSYSVYTSYFSAGGRNCKIALFFLIFFFTQVMITGGDYWINFWINHEYIFLSEINTFKENNTLIVQDSTDTNLTATNFRQKCIIIYAGLMILLIGTWMARNFILVSVCMRASINLHNGMFNSIIKTTMNFFTTNSSGRIFNRFSKDIGAIDDILPNILFSYFHILLLIMGIVFVVGFVNIYLMIPTFIIGLIFHYIKVFCLPTSRSVKRLEGITRSPIFSHLNASIQGLTTIRAYGAEETLVNEFDKYQDVHSSAWYLFNTLNEAFGFWLDTVCIIYIGIITFSFLVIDIACSGNIGLAITQIITLSGMVQWGLRLSTMLENQMISVERVLEYTNCPREGIHESDPNKKPPNEWPDSGKIVFKNFYLRYSLDAPHILKNINIRIQPMEKIGIVGRTGAGKSSLTIALFRLAHNEGNIFIDDLEIHELGLHDLRSKIAIIPQEPVLFSGTLRTNLDPINEYADHILWNALDKVKLKDVVEDMNNGLNSKMSNGGSNFSAGQRQLICLARALIRNNRIIILDEATANVDPKTDKLIQNTIRKKFRTCTVLTIAHRLNTIMDSDKVLVMNSGTMVEFDHPYNLLRNKDGFFYKMVEKLGQEHAASLRGIAKENYNAMDMALDRPAKSFLA